MARQEGNAGQAKRNVMSAARPAPSTTSPLRVAAKQPARRDAPNAAPVQTCRTATASSREYLPGSRQRRGGLGRTRPRCSSPPSPPPTPTGRPI